MGDSAEIVTEVSVEPRHLHMVHLGGQDPFCFIKIPKPHKDLEDIYKVCQMHFSHFINSEL